jgi:hypothetical protein
VWRKQGGPEALAARTRELQAAADPPPPPAPVEDAAPARISADKRLNPIKLRQLKDRHRAIEGQVAALESAIAVREAELGNFVSVEETKRVNDLLQANRASLESLMKEWEEVTQSLEANA